MANELLLSSKQVSEILGIKLRTLQQWRLLGHGPKHIRLSEKIIRYRLEEVERWIADAESSEN